MTYNINIIFVTLLKKMHPVPDEVLEARKRFATKLNNTRHTTTALVGTASPLCSTTSSITESIAIPAIHGRGLRRHLQSSIAAVITKQGQGRANSTTKLERVETDIGGKVEEAAGYEEKGSKGSSSKKGRKQKVDIEEVVLENEADENSSKKGSKRSQAKTIQDETFIANMSNRIFEKDNH